MTALVIGIGHPYRRDDSIGLFVAEAVAALALPGFEAIGHLGDGCDLMACWPGFDVVVMVDATLSGAVPGTIRVWNATETPLPAAHFPKSSHSFGLAEAVEMARLLDRLPGSLHVVGIEAADLAAGEGLSPVLAAALPHIVRTVLTACHTPAAQPRLTKSP